MSGEPSWDVNDGSVAWIKVSGVIVAFAMPALANTWIIFRYFPFGPHTPFFAGSLASLNLLFAHVFLYATLVVVAGVIVWVGPSNQRLLRIVTATSVLGFLYILCAVVSWALVFFAAAVTN